MHIKDKYQIQALWQNRPDKIVLRIPVEKFNRINDEQDGVLHILGDLYKIIGENQECGMIDMRVEKIF